MSVSYIRGKVTSELRWFASAHALVDRTDRDAALLDRASQVHERLEVVYDRLSDLVALGSEVEKEVIHAIGLDVDQCQEYADAILQRVADIKKQSSSGGNGGSGTSSGVISRLPSIDLPIFHGDLNEWVGFINLFDSLVHGRSDLTASYKMAQLRGALRGEPGELVAHLPITNDNYAVARQILFDRYQNQRRLVDAQLARLFAIPKLSRASDIRAEVLNPVTVATKALGNLGLPVDQWSYLLFYIVAGRLPVEVLTRFEQQDNAGRDELPTLANLLAFLEGESRRHEIMPPPSSSGSRVPASGHAVSVAQRGGGGDKRGPSQRLTALMAAVGGPRCAFCHESGHDVAACPRFRSTRIRGRRNIVAQRRWCFFCFGPHTASVCPQPQLCPNCDGRHHALLCLESAATPRSSGRSHPASPTGERTGRSPRQFGGVDPRKEASQGGAGLGTAGGCQRMPTSYAGVATLSPRAGPCSPAGSSSPAHSSPPPSEVRFSPPLRERPTLERLPPVFGPFGHRTRRYMRRDGKRGPYVGAWDPLARYDLPSRADRDSGDPGPR